MQDTLLHPLSSSNLSNLWRLISSYGCQPRFLPRLAYLGLMCLVRQPFSWLESARFSRRIERQPIEQAPVFIIGHWRSGTTHLQNLMSQDPQFGRVTLLQAAMPHEFLSLPRAFVSGMQKALPQTRLMDNVPVAADAPWEEEMALASCGQLSFYHVSFFPKHIERIFRTAVLFDGGDARLQAQWQRQYLHFLKKVQVAQPGRRLLLKNPANTARIALLKRMFPGARFIHIHRDPYKVFASTVHLYLKAQEAWGLHATDRDRIACHVLQAYRELMSAYFTQCDTLDEGELVEISFRDLQRDPMATLAGIYDQIDLAGFNAAAPHFQRYLNSQRGYRKNHLSLSAVEKRRIGNWWRESFERLGYAM